MPLAPHADILAADLSDLSRALARDGYTESACEEIQSLVRVLGLPPPAEALAAYQAPAALRVHVALWALGLSVPRADMEHVTGPGVVATLLRLGVLEEAAGGVKAVLSVLPSDGVLTTRDFDAILTGKPAGDDYVLGIGPSTRRLAALMVPRPSGLTLDIGTGQGFLSLYASGWSERVVSTDINERALAAAALSANLSGKRNIELRQGSFFEPAADLRGRCDQIVSNPPFVIQPTNGRVCFTAEQGGDWCMQHLVEEGVSYLRPGGWLSIIGNWSHADEGDWPDRPMAWAKGRGCDLWVIRNRSWSPRAYARTWIEELSQNGASADRNLRLDEWLEYYESLKIKRITMGGLVLRRREGEVWARYDTLPVETCRGVAGEQVLRLFENQTLLNGLGPEAVLDLRVRPTKKLEIDQRHRVTEDGFVPASITLRQAEGFPMPLSVQAGALEVLRRLDGTRTCREVGGAIAGDHGGDAAEMARGIGSLVMELLRLGHVEVVGQS